MKYNVVRVYDGCSFLARPIREGYFGAIESITSAPADIRVTLAGVSKIGSNPSKLSGLILGKEVYIEEISKEANGGTIANVKRTDGTNVNEAVNSSSKRLLQG